MTDWQAGHYNPGADAWQFFDGTFEIVVPGNIAEPSSHWLRVARETMELIAEHHSAAREYLDSFVERSRFAADAEWQPEFIEFGRETNMENVRFVVYYRIDGDDYGLWSVAFHPTGLPAPNDLYPIRLARQQQ